MDTVAPSTLPIDIQQQMAMAFNEPIPQPASQEPAAPAADGPLPTAEPSDTAILPQSDPSTITAAGEENVTYIDPNQYLKEHLGFDSVDAIKMHLQELQQKAQTPAEIKYANDEAKRWAEYFSAGKEDELYQSLHARQQVKNIDSLNDEQKLKLFIKMQNPLFDQELVDYQYQMHYGFDESKFKDEDGNITDPMALKFAKLSALQKIQSDLGKATDFFGQYKSKIELPAIQPQAPQSIDDDYESYKASTAKSLEDYNNMIVPALKSLSEADLNMNFNINDPNNQMLFDFGIAVDKNDFDSARQDALNLHDWLNSSFYDEKGSFQPKNLVMATLLYKNFGKYAQSIARQAVNAERKRMIEKETPNGQLRRDFNIDPGVKNELDEQMKRAFAV